VGGGGRKRGKREANPAVADDPGEYGVCLGKGRGGGKVSREEKEGKKGEGERGNHSNNVIAVFLFAAGGGKERMRKGRKGGEREGKRREGSIWSLNGGRPPPEQRGRGVKEGKGKGKPAIPRVLGDTGEGEEQGEGNGGWFLPLFYLLPLSLSRRRGIRKSEKR